MREHLSSKTFVVPRQDTSTSCHPSHSPTPSYVVRVGDLWNTKQGCRLAALFPHPESGWRCAFFSLSTPRFWGGPGSSGSCRAVAMVDIVKDKNLEQLSSPFNNHCHYLPVGRAMDVSPPSLGSSRREEVRCPESPFRAQ